MKKCSVFGLYSIRWRNAKTVFKWTPPFLASCDGAALNALLKMSNECPELQNRYLCKVGTFDPLKGVVKGCKPIIITAPKNGEKGDKDEVQN